MEPSVRKHRCPQRGYVSFLLVDQMSVFICSSNKALSSTRDACEAHLFIGLCILATINLQDFYSLHYTYINTFFSAALLALWDLSSPNLGLNPCPLKWKPTVLTNGSPGNSKHLFQCNLKIVEKIQVVMLANKLEFRKCVDHLCQFGGSDEGLSTYKKWNL